MTTKPVLPPTPESTSTPSLPDDLLITCIAPVPRLYYPILSLVSKSFRSLIVSPELYKTRALLGQTESCLYVCLRSSHDTKPRWFTLCRIPDRNKYSSGILLAPISSPDSPHAQSWRNHVAVGSNIYQIGGDVHSSSKVSVLDCKSHTWHEAPSMEVVRNSSSTVSLLEGKIYVAGGCEDHDSANYVEAFDPKTQTWSSVASPRTVKRYNGGSYKSLGLDGKLFLCRDDYWPSVYNLKEGRWNPVKSNTLFRIFIFAAYCVIDNVLFFWDGGRLKWYDYKKDISKSLKCVEGLPDFDHSWGCRKVVDNGGKMVVLWDKWDCCQNNRMIWCAEIALERCNEDEICGKVEWFDFVLRVPGSCHIV
ncbi:unnamed protein product [Microthlaspi erraticum]|uniref:Uncharacterized protein n=1 Tax=Microthlaspi erraticum TaxID=1685480 RepID=A0A6D2I809_9BRAS|nr:unnamed protein product [Microthlaspi erraticum]